ncbi:hypothetical protein HOP50_05g39780 [Chloropicon primus]|nr:hypothetical protein HOP50_05g39780 [Chloropicon primus]
MDTEVSRALRRVADDLKRELAGAVDDVFGSTVSKREGETGPKQKARAESLVSELKQMMATCVEGRKHFSDAVSGRVGQNSIEATEKLVSVLQVEVDFLKLRLDRERDERSELGKQLGNLEEERKRLESQSRRIEDDITEASESNARLEVAFGKAKRLVNDLRNSIDLANLVKKEKGECFEKVEHQSSPAPPQSEREDLEAPRPADPTEPAAGSSGPKGKPDADSSRPPAAKPVEAPKEEAVTSGQSLTRAQKKKLKKKQKRMAAKALKAQQEDKEEVAKDDGDGKEPVGKADAQVELDPAPAPVPSVSPEISRSKSAREIPSSSEVDDITPEGDTTEKEGVEDDRDQQALSEAQETPAVDVKLDDNSGSTDSCGMPSQPVEPPQASESPVEADTSSKTTEQTEVEMPAAPAAPAAAADMKFDDNFGSTDLFGMPSQPVEADTSSKTTEQTEVEMPAAPAAPAAAADMKFDDNFGSTDLFGMPSQPVEADTSSKTTEQTEVEMPAAPAAPAAAADMKFDDNFGSTDLFGMPSQPVEADTSSKTTEQTEVEMPAAPAAPAAAADMKFDDNFGSTDLFGMASQPVEQSTALSDDLFAPAPTGQQQWQDMDLFEPLEIQPTQAAAPNTAKGAENSGSAFDSNSWVDFSSVAAPPSQPQNPEVASSALGQSSFDADLLSWGQPSATAEGSGAAPQQPAPAFVAGPPVAEPSEPSSWAQFGNSPPQFWNDLPAPVPVPSATSFDNPDVLPSTQNTASGQALESVDFFGMPSASQVTQQAGQSQAQQQPSPNLFAMADPGLQGGPSSIPSSGAEFDSNAAWGEDPFQSQQQTSEEPAVSQAPHASPQTPVSPSSMKLRSLSEIEINKCKQAFKKLAGSKESAVTKEDLHKYYTLTSLPEATFSTIWRLTDPPTNGQVSEKQFFLFMYFMTAAVKGSDLPESISKEDIAFILGKGATEILGTPPGSSPSAAQAVGGTSSASIGDPKLRQLVELGFDEAAAKSALAAAGNDVDTAANYLFGDSAGGSGPAQAPPQNVPGTSASGPVSLYLEQLSSDVSKVASRVFLQIKVLGPAGNSLEQNNMVEIGLGSSSRKEAFTRIDRALAYEHSFETLLQSDAKFSFEVKKEKKRSFVGKAWGVLDLKAMADVIASGHFAATGNILRIPLSSKPIDVANYKNKKSAVKGSSSQLHLKLTW